MVVATPEKAWLQQPKSAQRVVVNLLLLFSGLLPYLLVFSMIPMTVSFLPNKVKQSKGLNAKCLWDFNYCYLCFLDFSNLDFGADALMLYRLTCGLILFSLFY
jgi:hypothetical protein